MPIIQAKVGPTMEPGRGLSLIPAVHRSRSSGLEYVCGGKVLVRDS